MPTAKSKNHELQNCLQSRTRAPKIRRTSARVSRRRSGRWREIEKLGHKLYREDISACGSAGIPRGAGC
jgi:hypothetical protein